MEINIRRQQEGNQLTKTESHNKFSVVNCPKPSGKFVQNEHFSYKFAAIFSEPLHAKIRKCHSGTSCGLSSLC